MRLFLLGFSTMYPKLVVKVSCGLAGEQLVTVYDIESLSCRILFYLY